MEQSEVTIKVEKFLMKQGIRVGKAALEFKGGVLDGFHLVGFTICDDTRSNNRYVMFPMSKTNPTQKGGDEKGYREREARNFFFLRPDNPERLDALQNMILDVYDSLLGGEFRNVPRLKQAQVPTEIV